MSQHPLKPSAWNAIWQSIHMLVQFLFWLSALASSCAGLRPEQNSRTSQIQRDPLLCFNSPTEQFLKEKKQRIPHDERTYRLWNQHFDFKDKNAVEKLSNELEDLHDQLMEQLLDVQRRSMRIRASLSSETWPLEHELLSLRNELSSLEDLNMDNLDPVELQGQAHSLRQSIGELDTRLKHILREAIRLEECQDDLRKTIQAVGKTQASIPFAGEWMGYFELIRLHLSGFKEPHKSPNYGKWINSRYILAEDVPLGTSVFQGPELGTSKFPSGLDSMAPNRVSSSYSTQLITDGQFRYGSNSS
jgi:hypothetical protein